MICELGCKFTVYYSSYEIPFTDTSFQGSPVLQSFCIKPKFLYIYYSGSIFRFENTDIKTTLNQAVITADKEMNKRKQISPYKRVN